ncbi:MAG: hypothetical protein PHG82_02185 [Candidatus Gracilibacteria bacterium]|nr:hypothetical protein [Candidatus Gracilibacteria bacterium]
MKNGLEIYQTKNSVLPVPDAQIVNIGTGGSILEYQGYAGINVISKIKYEQVKDPKDNISYTYSTNGDYTKFQLMSMLENGDSMNISQNPINTTYAANDYTGRKTYVIGNKLGVFLNPTTNAPIQETLSGNIDLAGAYSRTNFKVVFSNTSSNSGTITGTGTSLYNNIIAIANTTIGTITLCNTGFIKNLTNVCVPIFIGSTVTIGTGIVLDYTAKITGTYPAIKQLAWRNSNGFGGWGASDSVHCRGSDSGLVYAENQTSTIYGYWVQCLLKNYTCNAGDTLAGTTCTQTPTCPSGYTDNGTNCKKNINYTYYNYICDTVNGYTAINSGGDIPKVDPNLTVDNTSTLNTDLNSAIPPANNCKFN